MQGTDKKNVAGRNVTRKPDVTHRDIDGGWAWMVFTATYFILGIAAGGSFILIGGSLLPIDGGETWMVFTVTYFILGITAGGFYFNR